MIKPDTKPMSAEANIEYPKKRSHISDFEHEPSQPKSKKRKSSMTQEEVIIFYHSCHSQNI